MVRDRRFEHRDLDEAEMARLSPGRNAGWYFMAENLARSTGATEGLEVVRRFLASESHRVNVLALDATHSGAGCVEFAGEFWCVQIVAGR
jgi:uncharacterized protein YkwD